MERCSPPAAPFPPRPPQEVFSLVRSVHRYYGAVRLLQHVHVRRSVYGLRGPAFAYSRRRVWRSPGSRACCFLACAGSQTTQDQTATRDHAAAVLPSSYSEGSRHPDLPAFVASRTGAILRRSCLAVAPRFLWECLTSKTVSWFPAPATSNAACGFAALRSPVPFTARSICPQ
jgi:hypothetical protein